MSDLSMGAVSADGNFYWDGTQWRAAVSPDGAWRWNGTTWVPAQGGFAPAAPYASPRELGIGVSALLGLTAIATVIEALLFSDYFEFNGGFGDFRYKYSLGIAGTLTFALTSILFVIWFHRAYANLVALGARELPHTANGVVAWWVVPLAGLWKPYQAVREIWAASDPTAGPTTTAESRRGVVTPLLFRSWWTAWLAALFLFNFATVTVPDNIGLYWQSALSAQATVLAAVLAIMVVTAISARQDARWRQIALNAGAGDP